ncbi:32470_t:CDS:2, partial [Racocetra persica]
QLLQIIEMELENILFYKIQRINDCDECKKAINEINKFEKYLEEENNPKLSMDCKQTIGNYIELNRRSASSKLVHIVEAGFLQKETWNLLRNNTLSAYPVKSVENLIYLEVESIYSSWWNSTIESEYKNGTLPDLHEVGRLTKRVLQKQDIDTIEERLDNLTDLILKGKSQHFYNGIVSDLKNKIEKTLSDFTITKPFLIFKRNAHIYALLKFKQRLSEYQKKWDEENHPLNILEQKKEEYFNVIRVRLQHESTLVSEAYIVANYLLRVIHKKAMKAGNHALKDAVNKIPWMTSTETVRLQYFEELAIEVQNGNKENALNHFKNPKYHIENWFKSTVDNTVKGNPVQKYNDTYSKEIKRVCNDICNCKDYKEIELFVNNYMTQVDKIDYKCNLEDSIKLENFKTFSGIIIKEIKNKIKEISDNIDNCYSNQKNKEPFQRLSEDKSIMKMLGCTESCYWCGALCWGSLGHHENSDDSKIHHASHQPRGFRGTKDQETRELIPIACHQRKDLIKCDKLFNDLMCWFFEKLNEDLANYYVCEPASRDSLNRNGCLNLNYDDIISELREKLYSTLNPTEYDTLRALKNRIQSFLVSVFRKRLDY